MHASLLSFAVLTRAMRRRANKGGRVRALIAFNNRRPSKRCRKKLADTSGVYANFVWKIYKNCVINSKFLKVTWEKCIIL